LDELARQGFVEGKNLDTTFRYASTREEILPRARELAALRMDLFLVEGTNPTRAMQSLTTTIPIVFVPSGDPVAAGLVRDLVRPGGNTTGVSSQECVLIRKRLELLRELVPHARRIVLITGILLKNHPCRQALDEAGPDVRVIVADREAASTVEAVLREKPDAIMSTGGYGSQAAVTEALGSKLHVAIIADTPAPGVVVLLSANEPEMVRRGADQVARILRGAQPGEMPVELVSSFRIEVDRRVAARFGIRVPESILLRADRIID
ncbi:MAG: ABC transporter substrate-binding protein, partial [Bacillota bacterium]